MEARYAFRKRPLLDECPMAPEIFEQVMPRLSTFMQPFGRIFQGQAADQHATTSVCGLLSNVERKNIASMAYRFGQSRLPLPSGIGWDAWDDAPLGEVSRKGHTLVDTRRYLPKEWTKETTRLDQAGGPTASRA